MAAVQRHANPNAVNNTPARLAQTLLSPVRVGRYRTPTGLWRPGLWPSLSITWGQGDVGIGGNRLVKRYPESASLPVFG